MIRYFLFSIIFSLSISASKCYAQSDTLYKKYYKNISLSFEKGPILKSGFPAGDSLIADSKYNGIELRLGWRKRKPDLYSSLYRYPTTGAVIYIASFGNSEIGQTAALSYFFTIPLLHKQHKINFSYSFAFGLSYNNEVYDKSKNPQDIFISNAFNCSAYLGMHMNYKISDRLKATATLGFRHFSNGSSNMPNIGLNILPLSIGLQYSFEEESFDPSKPPLISYQSHNLFSVFIGLGSKAYAYEGSNYLKGTAGFYFLRQVSYKYRLGVGIDVFYSSGTADRSPDQKADFGNSVSLGIAPTCEWVLGKKLYAPMSIGFYFHRNEINDETTFYYLRGGFRYRFTPHFFAGLTIKAHSYYSDYFEWTLGYTFHKDPNKY